MTDFEPFDLARAEAGEPIQFRKGKQDIRLVGVLRNAQGIVTRLVIETKDSKGYEYERIYFYDGKNLSNCDTSLGDLVMKPKPPITKKYWVGLELYGDGNVRKSWVAPFPPITQWHHVIEVEITLPPTKR